ncbi:MAG: Na/Pi cotransporter family protein [Oscillospiraceae bacterium]|jgi:phosphate:Na+ symporter|nr:Na/Pi cotransporter family protein [Oscillospiraceae bacterium]
MNLFNVVALLGGLAMFLYGMNIMGAGLEKLAGGKAEQALKRMTSTPARGALLGAAITAIIQSSSATTVILVGLVNGGIMRLSQTVGVIMGANVGTTITGQIIRLSDLSGDNLFLKLMKPSTLAPLALVLGVVFFMIFKSARKRNLGQIFLGFGILFTGMLSMEGAVRPLEDSAWFAALFTSLRNPVLGVLAGLLVTCVIQSSSASVGILQALTVTGAIAWGNAVPIILGQNIGTCITALLSSLSASRQAKRVAFTHIYFNVLGSVFFLILIYAFKAVFGIPFWDDAIDMGDIANFHTVFNVICTLLFLPANKLLLKLSCLTVPVRDEVPAHELSLTQLDPRLYASPAMALDQAKRAVEKMCVLAAEIFGSALDILLRNDPEARNLAERRENLSDALEVNITNYLVGITRLELDEREGGEAAMLLSFVSEFERICDRCVNVIERAGEVADKGIDFSGSAKRELRTLEAAVKEVIALAAQSFTQNDLALAAKVEPLEETIDVICEELRSRHISRLKDKQCSVEAGVVFLEVLNNYERISDHCSNVAARLIVGAMERSDQNPHALLRRLHSGADEGYRALAEEYAGKYRI